MYRMNVGADWGKMRIRPACRCKGKGRISSLLTARVVISPSVFVLFCFFTRTQIVSFRGLIAAWQPALHFTTWLLLTLILSFC